MRKVCKIIAFGPEETRKSGDSEQREFKVRKVVIDASRFNEETGENVTEKYVADTFRFFTDEQLQAWVQSGEKLACYITFDADCYEGLKGPLPPPSPVEREPLHARKAYL